MSSQIARFLYLDDLGSVLNENDFVLDVPAGKETKVDLLKAIAKGGNFPYLGMNWDALSDCLTDLSWISNIKIVIVHHDLPLASTPLDCLTYIDILRFAQIDWTNPPRKDLPSDYVAHELSIIFPTHVELLISKLSDGAAGWNYALD
jgi:hypothetical protein